MQHINTILTNLGIMGVWVSWLTNYIPQESTSVWLIIGVTCIIKFFSLLAPPHKSNTIV